MCRDQNENEIGFGDRCLATLTKENQVNNINGVVNEEVTKRECEGNIG